VKTLLTQDVGLAADILGRGGLVAFPTETVYGLGADARNPEAVRRIFLAKGRPADNPLIVHIAHPADITQVAVVTASGADLARRYWPGPLTLVLPVLPGIPDIVVAGLSTVAVRCPDHAVARSLLLAAGCAVAAPSANRSGRPSPTTAAAVLEDLDGRIDAVLDGGPCRLGVESTVVDCTGADRRILRLGALAAEELGLPPRLAGEGSPRSPGTRYRHYAPAIPLFVVDDLAVGLRSHPEAAVLCSAQEAALVGLLPGPSVHLWAQTPIGRAAELFAVLRGFEATRQRSIVVTPLPQTGIDAATMDRLVRASAGAREDSPARAGRDAPAPGVGGFC